ARAIAEALAARRPYRHEYRIVWPDGSVHWIAGQGEGFYVDNKPVRMTGTVIDVTERKRAEETNARRLAELQRWFATMLGREERIMSLKREVNELSRRLGEPSRYAAGPDSAADGSS
ncbi:MAG TPA: PAS domain-containing protein, partial [Burkholderiales bacterium]|nr:PAS domain-containing protein [Burkholderiales bacterium]